MEDAMVEYNPFSYEIHEDPYPTYRRLRDEAPAYYNEELDFWALSRFEDVLEGPPRESPWSRRRASRRRCSSPWIRRTTRDCASS
jgi:cytochrome P450